MEKVKTPGSITDSGTSVFNCRSQFINNTVSRSGGAIYKTRSNDSTMIHSNYFSGNTENVFGGALYYWHKQFNQHNRH